jgi:hypothetical protein
MNVDMSKRHKKRNKRYQGEDAATAAPEQVVYHYEAVDRGRFGQWWFEHKKAVLTGSKIGAIGLAVVWLLYELILIVT